MPSNTCTCRLAYAYGNQLSSRSKLAQSPTSTGSMITKSQRRQSAECRVQSTNKSRAPQRSATHSAAGPTEAGRLRNKRLHTCTRGLMCRTLSGLVALPLSVIAVNLQIAVCLLALVLASRIYIGLACWRHRPTAIDCSQTLAWPKDPSSAPFHRRFSSPLGNDTASASGRLGGC